MRDLATTLALATGFTLLQATGALAATVSVVPVDPSVPLVTELRFAAAPGEANDVVIAPPSGGRFFVRDAGVAALTPGVGCAPVAGDPRAATCIATGVSELDADLGNGNDMLRNGLSLRSFVNGGPGNDDLFGGPGQDSLDGGTGSDTIRGGPGLDDVSYAARSAPVSVTLDGIANDGEVGEGDDIGSDVEQIFGGQAGDRLVGDGGAQLLSGGPGDDILDGGGGADTLDGGDGTDTVTYASRTTPLTVTLDDVANDGAALEGDDVTSTVENVIGGSAADSLTGDASDNELTGGAGADTLSGLAGGDALLGQAGADTLIGGPGVDGLSGGGGADTLFSKDGEIDIDICGAGADTAHADAVDALGGCELLA
jgi:Ca2+-binding RTX toxin-like protein